VIATDPKAARWRAYPMGFCFPYDDADALLAAIDGAVRHFAGDKQMGSRRFAACPDGTNESLAHIVVFTPEGEGQPPEFTKEVASIAWQKHASMVAAAESCEHVAAQYMYVTGRAPLPPPPAPVFHINISTPAVNVDAPPPAAVQVTVTPTPPVVEVNNTVNVPESDRTLRIFRDLNGDISAATSKVDESQPHEVPA
jgi:hypothetical protein